MPTSSRRTLANAIRVLSMDAVQKANSGHPGMPMGMADIAQVLWQDFLQHNPKNPDWINRDRFILSNGHGAMLLYSLLHLTGYDLSIQDLQNFRQLHSKTPGHPEYSDTPGVETTTGPLGQGLANAVGFALAERLLASEFNEPGFDVIDHYTYSFVGDGCLMEGISHEVCSLAGTLGLGKLIVLFDDNGISIDGKVVDWFQDDTPKRFESYGWHVIANVDGHDAESIKSALTQAKQNTDKPTLICCKTVIGYGSPNLSGSEKTHGAPLGDKEIKAVRAQLGWTHEPFEIPDAIYQAWDATEQGAASEQQWHALFSKYQSQFPDKANHLLERLSGGLSASIDKSFEALLKSTQKSGKDMATRKASLNVLNHIGPQCSSLLGGSADLTGSNLTAWEGIQTIKPGQLSGQYIHYGVREFGMSAMMNGLALHGGFIPFSGTFLTFLDYSRNAVRMSALMKQQVIYVFTHDSIGLGEDGPTHQPIEHATMLRVTPHMQVWRPADDVETVSAWHSALKRTNGPTSLLLSRQTVPHLQREASQLKLIERGGYILKENDSNPEIILLSSGSEVGLCLQAYEILVKEGMQVRLISAPCLEILAQQDKDYLETLLPSEVTARIAVEAGDMTSWHRWVGTHGKVIGLDSFGASAPANVLYEHFGLTVSKIVEAAKNYESESTAV